MPQKKISNSQRFENGSKMSYFRNKIGKVMSHSIWKPFKMSHLNFSTLAVSTNFCLNKIDLSGITVWQQASAFQKETFSWIFKHRDFLKAFKQSQSLGDWKTRIIITYCYRLKFQCWPSLLQTFRVILVIFHTFRTPLL